MANYRDQMYRDPTPISPEKIDYDKSKVDPKVANYTRQVRSKSFGIDTREAMARAEEITSIVASEAKETSQSTEQRQDAVEQQFDDVLNEWTGDKPISNEETIAARTNRNTNENYGTIGQRLDAENKKVNAQLAETEQKIKLENANAEIPLNITTYYKHDDHAVHPSVLYFSDAKYGYNWVMAYTPYSEGRDITENPSISVSDDGYVWKTPEGLTNPLVDIPTTKNTYYSDTEIFDNGTELELWYRYSDDVIPGSQIWRRKSIDCVNWTEAELIFDFGALGESSFMSPSIYYENNKYRMWYRTNHGGGIRYIESTDLKTWSNPIDCTFDYTKIGEKHNEWHLQIRYIDGKYMAIINARRISDNEYRLVYLKSLDGINFNDAKLLMRPSYKSWDNDRLYRASIVKYGGWYYVYYSGFSKTNQNYIALSKGRAVYDLDELVGTKVADYTAEKVFGNLGIRALGDGTLQLFNAGVAATQLKPTKNYVTTLFDEKQSKKTFLDLAGLILDSDSNIAIYSAENGVFLNPTGKGLNVRKDGVTQTYARFISLELDTNNSDGVLTVRNGKDFIDSVVSDPAGFRINFKNMPHVFPFVNVNYRNIEGLITDKNPIGFIYTKDSNKDYAIIGLKQEGATGHTPLNEVTGGKIEVCIIF